MKKVKVTNIPHNPAIGGTFSVYWRCIGADNAPWQHAGDVEVDNAGLVLSNLEIEFDTDDCPTGISIQAMSPCNGIMTGKLFPVAATTTTTSTTTTTTLPPCPEIVQVFGVGYLGMP